VTPHQIVAVVLRLFAVWLGLQTLRTLPSFFALNGSEAPGYAYALFLFALSVVLIVALWFFPRTIAGRLLQSHEAQSQPPATVDAWLALGCFLLGVWTLTTTIPRLVINVYALNALSGYDDKWQLHESLVYNFFELVIALWLIFGAKGIRKLFWWAQNAGTRKAL
jgi:hypothetical protein